MSAPPRELAFVQVDVFTDRVFGGNPLAVFLDGQGLSTARMQAIAREMNLSETVFLLPSDREDCDARLRIFTPGRELPFAGHPTIGAAWVLREHDLRPPCDGRLTLEEGVGPVPVRFDGEMIWMSHPPADFGPPWLDRPAVAAVLGLNLDDLHPDAPVQIVSTGAPFLIVTCRDPHAVDRALLDYRAYAAMLPGESTIGIFLSALDPRFGPSTVHSRMLSGGATGIGEDPATGGASGPLGAYLLRHGLVQAHDTVEIVSRQGVQMGRPSTVHISLRPGDDVIEVGGTVVPVLTGTLTLPPSNGS